MKETLLFYLLHLLGDFVRNGDGFAQVFPEHKFLIVQCLRELVNPVNPDSKNALLSFFLFIQFHFTLIITTTTICSLSSSNSKFLPFLF